MTQKRDFERIRQILQEIKSGDRDMSMNVRNSHDAYQYYLMKDSGLLKYSLKSTKEADFYSEIRITNTGHDFLDAFDNKDNFEGVKKLAKEKGQELLAMPLDIAVKLGKQYIKQQLGL